MFESHPYEEVAYDVYPLENTDQRYAMGAIVTLEKALPFKDLLADVKKKLGLSAVKYSGDAENSVQHIAICGGSGSDLLPVVLAKKCDALLTGDIKYHFALDAVNRGLCLADLGHHDSELPVVEHLVKILKENFPELEVSASKVDNNPFNYL
jgi:putative NIF3 family GTP cyclohydrolase 1 type 2